MTIKILVDMNLSPDWVPTLVREGWEAVHWSAVGDPRAPDDELMTWAVAHRRIVFTHDLDFGAMLALAQAAGLLIHSSAQVALQRRRLFSGLCTGTCLSEVRTL